MNREALEEWLIELLWGVLDREGATSLSVGLSGKLLEDFDIEFKKDEG